MIKAKTLTLLSKSLATLLVLSAAIVTMTGHAVDMTQIIMAATFMSAAFITVDASLIKTSKKEEA